MKTIAIGIALALASPSTSKSPPELAPPPSPAEPAPPEATPPEATPPEATPPEATPPEATPPEATPPEATPPEATEPAAPVTTTPEPTTPVTTRPVTTTPVPPAEPVRPRGERGPGDRMVKAGVGVVIAGIAGYVLMAAGLGMGNRAEGELFSLSGREDIDTRREVMARGQLGNRLAIGGAVVATAAMAVGIPLIIIGRRRHEAASSRTTVMVSGGAGALGLRVQGRF